MIIDLVTVTPNRLRFLVNVKDEFSTEILNNATLVGFAIEPLRTILQQTVDSQAAARRLLLGTGAPGDVFRSPQQAIQPQRYCRVRIHPRTFLVFGESVVGADADDDGAGRADLIITGAADGIIDQIIDLEVEHTLTR